MRVSVTRSWEARIDSAKAYFKGGGNVTVSVSIELTVGTFQSTESVKMAFKSIAKIWMHIQFKFWSENVTVTISPKKNYGTAKAAKGCTSHRMSEKFAPSNGEPLIIASRLFNGSTVGNCFNGRISSPILSSGSKVLAKFDFLRQMTSDHIVDV